MYATPYSWVNSILIAGYTVFPLTVMLNNSVHSRRTVLVQFKLYCTVHNCKSVVLSIDHSYNILPPAVCRELLPTG